MHQTDPNNEEYHHHRVRAVSYTHLDVYKRQVEENGSRELVGNTYKTGLPIIKDPEKFRIVVAVSYTHLDVYKRQTRRTAAAGCSSSGTGCCSLFCWAALAGRSSRKFCGK